MIERIIEYCAKNRLAVIFTTAIMLAWSYWSITNIPLDALPDLSDTQVIVYAKWDRPPDIIENQVTYPIVTSMLGAPKVKDIRGFSDYGYSYTYIIFEDGTDVYWARSRVVEYLSKVTGQLPQGVKVELGPDATGLGWIYQYALVDETGRWSIADLRRFQDWTLRFALQSVKGVSEVATVGGFVKQYQVIVNPNALAAYKIPISDVISAVKSSNQEMGARLLEFSGREYMVTIKGYVKSKKDIEETVIRSMTGVPLRIRDIARVELGPDIRRGAAELNGTGEAVGGIIVMRYGENAMKVIEAVKERINEIRLPEGVKLVPVYDRSDLINRSVSTLKKNLTEEMIVVALVIIVFLMHFSSSMIPIITLPIATMLSFIPMYYLGLTSNIMSLGGIAIAIGAMVDASIVVVENAHRKVSHWIESGGKDDYEHTLIEAIKEVGRPTFFSLIVIAVAFIPIFTLEDVEGRLFRPLAFTKNFAMFFGAILAITLVPAIMLIFIRVKKFSFRPAILAKGMNAVFIGKIHKEEDHPISRTLFRIYTPVIHYVLDKPRHIIAGAVLLFIVTIPFFFTLGKEFMPPLNEGVILYMPTTLPGISVTESTRLLQIQDRILRSFPEVETVFGKTGRAETATDPAPYSMMETVVVLKPQKEWRRNDRWYSSIVPEFAKGPFRLIWPDILSWEELIAQMEEKLKIPGQINSWTMPIKGRTDMLTTGIRTPVGIKIYGDDLSEIERIGRDIEIALKDVGGTRNVFSERVTGGYFVNYYLNREAIARYGLSVTEVQMILSSAVGGENISESIEGRERYPINIRYPREIRDSVSMLKSMYIVSPMGGSVQISQIADIRVETGPGMIRDENGKLSGYVFIDVGDRDLGSYVNDAKKSIDKRVSVPGGYSLKFSGQYEFMERVKQRMMLIIPITLLVIFILIRINTGSYTKTFIVLLAVPFSLIGVTWILHLLDYNVSVGVWSGIIALLGVDAETGILMLLYLDLEFDAMKKKKKKMNLDDLRTAIMHGAVLRIRPKFMTILVAIVGLLPIMWSQSYDAGADVMKRIAAPMVGGILVSFVMELVVYPAVYFLWRKKTLHQ